MSMLMVLLAAACSSSTIEEYNNGLSDSESETVDADERSSNEIETSDQTGDDSGIPAGTGRQGVKVSDYNIRDSIDPVENPDSITYGIRTFSTELTNLDVSCLLSDWRYTPDYLEAYVELLRHMTNLTSLRLFNSQIKDITPLSGLTELTVLSLGKNEISDLTPLSNLTNLTHLSLYSNQINDISPLSNLTNLTHLVIFGNRISDLSPLSELTNLTVLELANNSISDLSPLSGLTNLQELTLYGNQINDFSPLDSLENLIYLNLSGNPVGTAGDSARLSLGDTREINISGRISAKVGDIVEFGDYSWIVLEVKDNHAMLITEYMHMMGLGQYNNTTTATWASSFIRHYLNGEFYYRFTPSERSRIQRTELTNERNPWYNTTGGIDTIDRVYLLSIREVMHYYGDSGQMFIRPDDLYIAYIEDEYNSNRIVPFEDGTHRWQWLRSSGESPICAAGIDPLGNLSIFGTGINNNSPGVRPVIWIDLEGL